MALRATGSSSLPSSSSFALGLGGKKRCQTFTTTGVRNTVAPIRIGLVSCVATYAIAITPVPSPPESTSNPSEMATMKNSHVSRKIENHVMIAVILVFTLSLGFYVTPALLGSPQQSLIAQLLAQRTTQLLDFAGAGALGMLVLVVTLVLVAWANRVGGTISAIGVVATSGSKGRP